MSYQGVGGWDLNFYQETKIPTLSLSHPVSSGPSDLFFFGPFDHTFLPRIGKPFQPKTWSIVPHSMVKKGCVVRVMPRVLFFSAHVIQSCFWHQTVLEIQRYCVNGFSFLVLAWKSTFEVFQLRPFFVNTWFYIRGC